MKDKHLKLLQRYDFEKPNFEKYEKNNIQVKQDKETKAWSLYIDKKEARTVDRFFVSCFSYMAMTDIAFGTTAIKGWGLGEIPNWLRFKPQVREVTVIEPNIDIIDYHEKVNTDMWGSVNMIQTRSLSFGMKCDVLLLDRYYTREPFDMDIVDFLDLIQKEVELIEHKFLWFWPLEMLLTYQSLQGKDLMDTYDKIRQKLPTLPYFKTADLHYYVGMSHFNFIPLKKK
mgnify:FL=1|tara:strand:+ start:3704 stop:4387 length:684 start_codon:yes stop_codon:yes gene_type:complete